MYCICVCLHVYRQYVCVCVYIVRVCVLADRVCVCVHTGLFECACGVCVLTVWLKHNSGPVVFIAWSRGKLPRRRVSFPSLHLSLNPPSLLHSHYIWHALLLPPSLALPVFLSGSERGMFPLHGVYSGLSPHLTLPCPTSPPLSLPPSRGLTSHPLFSPSQSCAFIASVLRSYHFPEHRDGVE